jgi:hypothetical protein
VVAVAVAVVLVLVLAVAVAVVLVVEVEVVVEVVVAVAVAVGVVVGVGVGVVVVGVVVIRVGVVWVVGFFFFWLAAAAVATVLFEVTFFTVRLLCLRAVMWCFRVLPEWLLDDAAASATLVPNPSSRAVERTTRSEARAVRKFFGIPPHRGATRKHGTASTNLDAHMRSTLDVCTSHYYQPDRKRDEPRPTAGISSGADLAPRDLRQHRSSR